MAYLITSDQKRVIIGWHEYVKSPGGNDLSQVSTPGTAICETIVTLESLPSDGSNRIVHQDFDYNGAFIEVRLSRIINSGTTDLEFFNYEWLIKAGDGTSILSLSGSMKYATQEVISSGYGMISIMITKSLTSSEYAYWQVQTYDPSNRYGGVYNIKNSRNRYGNSIDLNKFTSGKGASGEFPGENSSPGGGNGTFDIENDPIDFPELPVLSVADVGFISIYTPTVEQLYALGNYLWSDAFDVNSFKKLFADPMDVFLGLSIVPVSVPNGGPVSLKVGNIDTGISLNKANGQYVELDCGVIYPAEYYGSFLDYSPYTKFSIYLPYVGIRELNTDDVQAKSMQVKYHIDILSGSFTCFIKCGESVMYQYAGNCASGQPISSNDWSQLITSTIQLAASPIVPFSGGSANVINSVAGMVAGMKPGVNRAGGISGSSGLMGVQTPYIIWEVPRQSKPDRFNGFMGYPSNMRASLNSIKGYTEVEITYPSNFNGTVDELNELIEQLRNGVFL